MGQSSYSGYESMAQYQNQIAMTQLEQSILLQSLGTPIKKERTMFQEVKNDVTTFIKEHRGVIYFIALFLLVDHVIFKGVFKARLQSMAEALITKVEAKVAA